ncbi:hypothetical protein HPY31_15180 [Brevibacillus sp. HB1.3]|uniref:hypothetical protein n=1 Tax=Brevibacillus sp. HB1.3 TaxID=2738842 RepID=UPI001554922A|nr:hypothetical protein [Brevibacillus sp. HB1.3]NQF15258.1 hypothetical protein [Brevibacillus sp. HB1.3]
MGNYSHNMEVAIPKQVGLVGLVFGARAGVITIRAEIMNQEQFGWGICVKARHNEK